MGNPLEQLSQVVDFEMFRNALEDEFENKAKKNNAGANPYDVVMMFKVMIIKNYYNLSDHQVQFKNMIYNFFRLVQMIRLGVN